MDKSYIENLIETTFQDKKDSDFKSCRNKCEVIIWDKENKNKWWKTILNPPESMS